MKDEQNKKNNVKINTVDKIVGGKLYTQKGKLQINI